MVGSLPHRSAGLNRQSRPPGSPFFPRRNACRTGGTRVFPGRNACLPPEERLLNWWARYIVAIVPVDTAARE
jgi:hypothetical protein